MTAVDILNATVWATLAPSPIHGIGVFAIRDIPKDTACTDSFFSMPGSDPRWFRLTEDEMASLLPEVRRIVLDRGLFERTRDIQFPHPNDAVDLVSFMNHSNDPNTDGRVALRDIKAGEELTEDYGRINLHQLNREHYKDFL